MQSVILDASRKVAGWARAIKQARDDHRSAAKLKAAKAQREASLATFIGVTGSSAKTTTAALLGHILKGHDSVTERVDSNTLMPLANTLRRPLKDRYVVAELGLSKVDSIRLMAELLKPDVAIVTLIDLEHYSVFRTREAVAAEKGMLVSNIRPGGFAVLNADDQYVMAMAERTVERIVTFGQATGVAYRATDIHAAFPERLSLTIEWRGGRLALQTRYVAEHFWLPVTAAVAAALELGAPPETVAEQVAGCEPFPNRLSVAGAPDAPAICPIFLAPIRSTGKLTPRRARSPTRSCSSATTRIAPKQANRTGTMAVSWRSPPPLKSLNTYAARLPLVNSSSSRALATCILSVLRCHGPGM